MIKRLSKRLLYLVIMLIIATGISAEEIFRITTWEWLPMISMDGEGHGPLCRAVKEAFALEGIRVEYGFFPWKRSMDYVKKGKWDGTIIWSPTEERKKFTIYSDPIFVETMNFFHLKSCPFKWESIEDLKNLRIGATMGCNYGYDFINAEKQGKIKVDWVPRDEQNFRKLVVNRIDIFPLELGSGYSFITKYLTQENITKITHHPRHLKKDTYHLLFSKKIKKNREMVQLFNRGLGRLRESGKLQKYLNMAYSHIE